MATLGQSGLALASRQSSAGELSKKSRSQEASEGWRPQTSPAHPFTFLGAGLLKSGQDLLEELPRKVESANIAPKLL